MSRGVTGCGAVFYPIWGGFLFDYMTVSIIHHNTLLIHMVH